MTLENELKVQANSANAYVQKRYQGYGLKYHSHVIKKLMEGAHGRILDVGCGTGIIHDLYPDLDIIGIDISKDMLRYHKGCCLWASADSLPFTDRYFDFVVCRSVLHHLPDSRKALSEIKRVMKPGATFVCWETNKSWLAELVRRRTQHGDRFSKYHHSFRNLPKLIRDYFSKESLNVEYQGFMAYPMFGFPDIVDFSYWLWWTYYSLLFIDELFSCIPFVNRLGFAIMIKAKNENPIC